MSASSTEILTFDTTHHALWAEEIAQEIGIAYEVVPAPSGSAARCDIAIATYSESVGILSEALHRAGVIFRVFRASDRNEAPHSDE